MLALPQSPPVLRVVSRLQRRAPSNGQDSTTTESFGLVRCHPTVWPCLPAAHSLHC